MNNILVENIDHLPEVVKQIFLRSNGRKVWLFSGDLGAGKTTLIQELVRYLGSDEQATSPTFSIVNEYEYPEGMIYHMDLYRLKDIDEVLGIGIEEYLSSEAYCFIEWPEIAMTLLEDEAFKIHIEILENHRRKINLQ